MPVPPSISAQMVALTLPPLEILVDDINFEREGGIRAYKLVLLILQMQGVRLFSLCW